MTIDVIDNNRLQLAIGVLKLLLLHHLCTAEPPAYIKMMYESTDIDILNCLIDKYQDIEWSSYMKILKEPFLQSMLKDGILNHGELEKTFKNLIESQMNFDTEFDRDVLIKRFGDSAVNLSDDSSFADRFRDIHQRYVKFYGEDWADGNNRFYYRMFKGTEHESIISDLLNKMTSISVDDLKRINFVCQDMKSYIIQCDIHYDIIQTSNITDWLNTTANVRSFVDTVLSNLKDKGITIWRSLNGDYDLMNMLMLNSTNTNTLHVNIPFDDKSHFYKAAIITRKLSIPHEEQEIAQHVYFSKNFTPEEFLRSQAPFRFAVDNWIKTLIHLRNNINDDKCVSILQENIDDEAGGIDGMGSSHSNTFRDFLNGWATIVTTPWPELSTDYPHVTEFNNALHEMIDTQPLEYSSGCLGEIEYMYISISKLIKVFSDSHNVKQSHYKNHEILDLKHSTELFTIAVALSDTAIGSNSSIKILNGAAYGRKIFLQLYEKMCDL